jgi:hypothetical protein
VLCFPRETVVYVCQWRETLVGIMVLSERRI